MAKKKLSQLAAAGAVQDADLLYIVQGGVSKKLLASALLRPSTAATVLGLKGAAYKEVGTGATQVAAGNHTHTNAAAIGGPYTKEGVDNAPVGTIIHIPRTSPPAQYLIADGSLLSRSAYPKLWAEAQACGLLVSEATWFKGNSGCYSTGNGTTTFRIPDARGYGIRAADLGRGVDPGRNLGSQQEDAIQNITGAFGADDHIRTTLSGAFYEKQGLAYDADSGSSGNGVLIGFDASRVVRTAQETRSKTIAWLPCIKYASGGQP